MKRAATLTILLLIACGGRDAQNAQSTQTTPAPAASTSTSSAPAALTPEQLGELGAQLRKEPSRAQEILAAHGLNEKSFEKAIRDVTENPEASKRYAEAYRKASS